MADVLARPRPMENAQERLDSATRKLLLIAVAFLPLVLIIALRASGGFGALSHPGAMDCAQVARNVAEGRGFTTQYLTPLSLYKIGVPDPVPDVSNPPLYPLSLAVIFGAFGATDAVVIAASMGFFALTVLMVFLLARRHFSLGVGAVAAAVYSTGFEVVKSSIAGSSAMLAALSMMVFWYVLTSPGVKAPRYYLKAGMLLGLAGLAHYSSLLLLPPALVYVWYLAEERKRAAVWLFALGALVVCSPWLVRNLIVTGNPIFCLSQYDLLSKTDFYPGYNVYRTYAAVPSPVVFAGTHFGHLMEKLVNGLGDLYFQWPSLVGLYLFPFFVLSLVSRVRDRTLLAARRLLVAAAVILTLGVSVGDQAPALHLFVLAPMMTVFAAGYLVNTFNRIVSAPVRRSLLIAAIVAGAALPTGLALSKSAIQPLHGIPTQFRDLDRIVPSDGTVVSDCPWAVAWYGRRAALWLPLNPRQLAQTEGELGSIDAVFVSRYAGSFASADPAALVRLLTKPGAGGGYRVARVYRSGDVLLASRRYLRTE